MLIFPACGNKESNLGRRKAWINRNVLAKQLCREHNDLKIGSVKGTLPKEKNNQNSRDMDEFLGRTLMDERKWQGRAIDSQDNGPSDPFAFLKLFSCPCVNREACPDTQSKMCVWTGVVVRASRSAICGLKNITNKVKKKSSRCTFLCGKGIWLHVWCGHNKASYSHRKAVRSSGPQRSQIFGHSGLMCPGAIKHSLQRR